MSIEQDIKSGRLRLVYAREDKTDGFVYATFAVSKTDAELHGERVEARQRERNFGAC